MFLEPPNSCSGQHSKRAAWPIEYSSAVARRAGFSKWNPILTTISGPIFLDFVLLWLKRSASFLTEIVQILNFLLIMIYKPRRWPAFFIYVWDSLWERRRSPNGAIFRVWRSIGRNTITLSVRILIV